MPKIPFPTSPRQRRETTMTDASAPRTPGRAPHARIRRMAAVAALCALLALGAACGKKIMPQPQDNRELFSWRGVTAMATSNGCITARGEAQGNVDNLASVILEIQPLGGTADGAADSCAGCPFQATARQEFRPERQITPQATAIVEVTMCPDRKAPAYRWRLVGVNVLTRFAHALSKVQLLVVDPNAVGFELPVEDTRPQQQTEIVIP